MSNGRIPTKDSSGLQKNAFRITFKGPAGCDLTSDQPCVQWLKGYGEYDGKIGINF